MPNLTRRVAMAGLVRRWAERLSADTLDLLPGETVAVPTSPADAARLASDLLALMDPGPDLHLRRHAHRQSEVSRATPHNRK